MKTFKIFCEEKHEYDIQVDDTDNGTVYSMFRSKADTWTNPGEFIIRAKDDGDGFTFSRKLGKELDYSELIEIKILLNLIARMDLHSSQYEAIESPENPIFV
jgi:hypothetical protein